MPVSDFKSDPVPYALDLILMPSLHKCGELGEINIFFIQYAVL